MAAISLRGQHVNVERRSDSRRSGMVGSEGGVEVSDVPRRFGMGDR